MHNFTPCVSSWDCDPFETNRLCYFGNGTLGAAQDGEDGEGRCLCNAYLGWTGPDCDEYSQASIATMAWMCTVAGISAMVVLLMIYVVWKSWSRAGETTCQRLQYPRLNSSLLNLGFSFSLCMWALMRGLGSFSQGDEPAISIRDTIDEGDYGYFSRLGDVQDFIFIPLTGFFGVFSTTNIAWIWIITAENVNHISDAPKILLKYRIALWIISIIGVAGILSAAFLDRTSPDTRSTVGYFMPIHGLFLIILYIYGSVQFGKLLRSGEENSEEFMHGGKVGFKVTRINVKWTSRAVIAGLVLQTTSWFAYSLLDNVYCIHTFTNDFQGTLVAPAVAEMLTLTGTLIITCAIGISLFNHTVPNAAADVRRSMRNLARVTTEALPRMFGTNSSNGSNESDEKTRKLATKIAREWSFELLEEKELALKKPPPKTTDTETEEKLDI